MISIGDRVVVINPEFFKQYPYLNSTSTFLVTRVESQADFPLGPGCSFWNNDFLGELKRPLKNECGRSALGLVCHCAEFYEQCGKTDQRLMIEFPHDQKRFGEPDGCSVTSSEVKKL